MSKKLLTLDDLVTFCENNNMFSFSSETFGSQIAVQTPAIFEFSNENEDDSLLDVTVKVCHTLKNRNQSFISEENMKRAMPTLKYKAILASFVQNGNDWDFGSHDMEISKDENGEDVINYIEQPVGCFTADDPYLEYDKKLKRTYVIAKGKIFKEYTKASDIILAKGGTKVSCELLINKFQYNAKEKYLELIDFTFSGCTLLGENIAEGMQGSRLDIEDFSATKNSLFSNNDELIEVIQGLKSTLDNYMLKNYERGGNDKVKFEELLKKYSKTLEEITFDYENMTDEELEAKFKEEFEDGSDGADATDDASGESSESVDSETDTTIESEDDVNGDLESENEEQEQAGQEQDQEQVEVPVEEETNEEEPEAEKEKDETEISNTDELKKKLFSINEDGNMVVSFEISHDDIRHALYELVYNNFVDEDAWYYISAVYDDYFVMEDCDNKKVYGQKYTKENDVVAFDGERFELFKELLTVEEKEALDNMRAKLAEIEEELASFKEQEENKKKCELVDSVEYVQIHDTAEFEEVVKNIDNYSSIELQQKFDELLLNHVKKFSLTNNQEQRKAKNFFMANNYVTQSKSSFLDGLKNK